MRRATIVLLIFLVIAAAIIGVSFLLQNQPAVEFTIAVDPLAETWIQEAATAFNESDPIVNGTQRVLVNITVINDLRVWEDNPDWSVDSHPAGWLAASSTSVEYAPSNFPLRTVQNSVASTPLVWGGFESRVNVITEDGVNPFGWETVAAAAEAERWSAIGGESDWNFIKLAFNRPSNSMAGVGVLLSGAAAFNDIDTLDSASLGQQAFLDWFQPIMDSVPNFQTLGANPAATMAGRGTSVVEIALLPEVQWLSELDDLTNNEPVVFAYPEYQFALDFPLVAWDDAQTDETERAAVSAFGEFLLTPEMQSLAESYGLRPVSNILSETNSPFTQAADFGISVAADTGVPIQIPNRSDTTRLIEQLD